jgi:two-component system, sensor histidine kinase
MSSDTRPVVLLVDDNHETCTLVQALLRREFSVDVAHDGVQALELMKTRAYAAVLLDLRMPVLDGFGVLEAVRELRPTMLAKIVIVTASLTNGDVARAREFGVHDLVAKPFEVEHFVHVVRRCAHGDADRPRSPFISGSMLLLLADLLHHRWPM